jgi:cob(I)alamin adenosyltransferase
LRGKGIVTAFACQIDWAALAAWVQAIFSVVAIFVAIQISNGDRKRRRDQEFNAQKAALTAIAQRAKITIERLQGRASSKTLKREEIAWLRDEASAISAVADGVDLVTLTESSLVHAFVEVQEGCRTASRRLKRDVAKAPQGGSTIPIDEHRFVDPLNRITMALLALEQAVQSES